MSRIGKLPINIPAEVTISVAPDNTVTVKGPKGELKQQVSPMLNLKIEEGTLTVNRTAETKEQKSLHGRRFGYGHAQTQKG